MTEKEFNHIILPLAEQVYAYVYHLTGNSEDAADITQDVMVKLWDGRRGLKEVRNPKAWALKLARNLCVDWSRKQKPAYDEGQLMTNEKCDTDLFRQIEARDAAETVRQIIRTLPASQQEVLVLREIEELGFEEIAQITGLEVNHIRVLLSRGRAKVREILAAKYRLSRYD